MFSHCSISRSAKGLSISFANPIAIALGLKMLSRHEVARD